MYRVGPLARLNVCDAIGTPWADAELADLRQRSGSVANSSFAYHHARLVEIVACLEGIEELVNDASLMDRPGAGPGQPQLPRSGGGE
jgi:NAD-reducing hydrogenase large subunit